MPLSEHEQRQFEAIERALLADDPKFAAAVRRRDPAVSGRRRLYLAAAIVLVGIACLLTGVISDSDGLKLGLGVGGFVVMLLGVVLGVTAFRALTGRVAQPAPPAPGVSVFTARRRARGHGGHGGRPAGAPRGLVARLEDRWTRRMDDGRF